MMCTSIISIIRTSRSPYLQWPLPLVCVVFTSQDRSWVSRVGSGHSHCIYGLTTVDALICQHKRGKIEGLMTRSIFHCSLLFPLVPTVQGSDTLFFLKPVRESTQGQAGAPNTHFLSWGHFKGQIKENGRITHLQSKKRSIFHQCWS